MTPAQDANAASLNALKRRFRTLVAGEVAAVALGILALVAHFAFHVKGALAVFAAVIVIAVLLQVGFILAFRRDMKKDV
jgi:hypothetical protein